MFQDRSFRAREDGEVFLHDTGHGVLGVRCATCLYTRRDAMRGFLPLQSVSSASVGARVEHCERHSTEICTSRSLPRHIEGSVSSVGAVHWGSALETNEKRRRGGAQQWTSSRWDEVAMGTRKYHRERRVRQSGVQWAVTGVHVDPESGKTLEIDCQFVPNKTAAALRSHVEARLASVQGASASTDAFRAYPGIMQSLGVTHET